MQLIGSLDICHFLEHIHQLRQVEEFCKSCSCPVSGSFRCQLNGCGGLTKGRSPAVEMGQPFLLQRTVLEIPHHGVKLRHAVANRGAGRKNDAAPACQLVHILALHKHIRRFLRFRCGQACNIAHFCVEEQILKGMCFVYKQSVYAQLLKGNHIVFSVGCPEFLQSRLQSFPGLFHLFDGETFAILGFHLSNGVFDFINLGSQNPLLPFCGHRNFLKLGMPDDDCIVITSSNSCAELLSAGSFKVLFACHQQFCTRIQTQKLVCPLKGQMIRNDKHGFLAQSQPFCLHSRSGHLESLTGTHFVGQQRIAAVQHMSNGILLVFPQPDFRIHAAKADMRTIILTGTSAVEQLVILFHKFRAAIRVFPHPVLERILNGLLFLLGEGGLLFIQNPLLLAVCILHGIVNTNIPQIQRILQNSIGIGTAGAVGHIGMNIIPARCTLTGDLPFCRHGREFHFNISAQIERRFKGFFHKLLDIIPIDPCGTKAHINLRCIQVFRLCFLQIFRVHRKGRVRSRSQFCHAEFFPDIAGQIFISRHPAGFLAALRHRVFENDTMQFLLDFFIFPRCT